MPQCRPDCTMQCRDCAIRQMTLFDEVVRDAAAAAARSAVVTVDEERVRHLAKSLHAPGPSPIGQRLPLRFASADDEMTFMALVSLLSFGASFRDRYRECLGQDMSPKEVAQRGVIGMETTRANQHLLVMRVVSRSVPCRKAGL